MAMQKWMSVDKSDWPEGPWQQEPDKAQWIAHGLDCLIVRGPLGALCGYVGVPERHPYFDKDYNDEAVDVSVHGGLTFAGRCQPEVDDAHGICHSEEHAAHKVVYWLGFDCGHSDDLVPKMVEFSKQSGSRLTYDHCVYRDLVYVQREVEDLAAQLAQVVA